MGKIFGTVFAIVLVSATLELSHEPRHEISSNVVHVCATSKASDQHAHTTQSIG